MTEYLVSLPSRLFLVRSTEANLHETDLVVPDAPVERIEYYRALVDEGTGFVEHAVVTDPGPRVLNPPDAVLRALTAARPTRVGFLDSDEHKLLSLTQTPCSPSQVAAAAVVLRQRGIALDGPLEERSVLIDAGNKTLRATVKNGMGANGPAQFYECIVTPAAP